ncbi:MAG TPA: Uma2 family endonuclease [Tepidisphaeraceae bacterium]|jgi:Uma2 family endonuclease
MTIAQNLSRFASQIVPLTVDQYDTLIRNGVVEERAPIELLDGILVRKDRSHTGDDPLIIGNDHIFSVEAVRDLNDRLRSYGVHMRSQQPIRIPPQNEPEPDGSVVVGSLRDYAHRKPEPESVVIVLEVADSSLEFDRTTKHAIYATAAIPQYVIVNLVDRVIEIYADPVAAEARYAASEVKRLGETLTLNLPAGQSLNVAVNDLLP